MRREKQKVQMTEEGRLEYSGKQSKRNKKIETLQRTRQVWRKQGMTGQQTEREGGGGSNGTC